MFGCFPLVKLSTTWLNTLNDLFALDKVSSLYETLPTSCLGTLILSLLISFLVGIPSCKTKAASHLVAITLSDLSSSLKAFAKHINEYILLLNYLLKSKL